MHASAPEPLGIVLPALQTPLADGFIGDAAAAFEQDLWPVARAQGQSLIEPDAVADDLAWKAVICVALGVGGRGHVWLPSGVFGWVLREQHRSDAVTSQEGGSPT